MSPPSVARFGRLHRGEAIARPHRYCAGRAMLPRPPAVRASPIVEWCSSRLSHSRCRCWAVRRRRWWLLREGELLQLQLQFAPSQRETELGWTGRGASVLALSRAAFALLHSRVEDMGGPGHGEEEEEERLRYVAQEPGRRGGNGERSQHQPDEQDQPDQPAAEQSDETKRRPCGDRPVEPRATSKPGSAQTASRGQLQQPRDQGSGQPSARGILQRGMRTLVRAGSGRD